MKSFKYIHPLLCLAASAAFLAGCSRSINPILTDAYAADPSAIVFGDTLFVYPSHDQNAGIGFNMEDYHCYYTTDMKHFTDGGVIFKPLEQTTWVKSRAWGPQCVRKMVPKSATDSTLVMRYFFYYSGNAGEIGVAVSDSPFGPFEDPGTITGDPQIQKIGDLYVMFYFRAFDPSRPYQAYNSFACSRDLIHWYSWEGEDLIYPSEPYDNVFAHKSYVVRWEGVTYHFYCAVNDRDERGIAVATSR